MPRQEFNWKLPDEITQRLGADSWGAQRAIFEKDHLLVILHEPPVPDGNERKTKVFLREPAGRWLCNGFEHGEVQFVRFFDDYRRQLAALEKDLAKARAAEDLFRLIERLSPLARATENSHAALQAGREKVKGDRALITARDVAYEVARGFELLLAEARLALEFHLARSGEQEARASERLARSQAKLNTLAALTLPAMAMASVLSMNLASGIEKLHAGFYWLVFALGLGLGAVATWWVNKK